MTGAILSIQSQVAYGHVGNSAAMLPLQRLGFDVLALNTVQLAHHPGYGTWRGHKLGCEQLGEILRGLEERGVLGRCVAVLSGYLGDGAVADVVLRAVAAVRRARPEACYLCDPVIGDDGPGVFVSAGVPEAIGERLVPLADIAVPNRFELAHLTGQSIRSLEDAVAAVAALRARGPRLVVATGLELPDRPDELAVLAATAEEAWLVATPRLPLAIGGGTGDAFAALFLGHYLAAADLGTALERAVAAMFALVARTCEEGAEELCLVAAQDAMVAPSRRFAAVRLR
ncbi:MAG: pyridoxal kinase PdxY [Geminicoccaceae bacterium]